jgi:translocation and assembly module TamB
MARMTRVAVGMLRVFGVVLLLAFGIAVSAVLHVDAPPARRLAAETINGLLEDTFRGRLVIERIGRLGPGGVSGVALRIFDADGREVLFASGVGARLDLLGLLEGLRGGRLRVHLPSAVIAYSEVRLIADAEGVPTLAGAFQPREIEDEDPASPDVGPEIAVELRHAHIERAWVHGDVLPTGPLDADVRDLVGRLDFTRDGLGLVLEDAFVQVRQMPHGADPRGRFRGRLATHPEEGITAVRAAFDGFVGSAPLVLRGGLEGEALAVTAEVGDTSPEDLRAMLPGVPVHAPVSARLQAEGTLEDLDVSARARLGDGTLTVRGRARLADPIGFQVQLRIQEMTLTAIAPDAPDGRIDLRAHASLALPEGEEPVGQLDATVAEVVLGGVTVPASRWTASLRDGVLEGRTTASVPGASIRVTYRLAGDASPSEPGTLGFSAHVDLEDPAVLERFGVPVRAQGTLAAQGRLELDPIGLHAEGEVRLRDVAHEAARSAAVAGTFAITGPWDRPVAHASVVARDVDLLGSRYARVRAHAGGSTDGLDAGVELVGAREHVRAAAWISFDAGVVMDRPAVSIVRNGVRVDARAARVAVSDEGQRVEGLVVRGVGAGVEADVHRRGAWWSVQARAEDLDLERLAQFAGVPTVRGGWADIRADVTLDGALGGSLRVRASDVRVLGLPPAEIDGEFFAEQERVAGWLYASAGHEAVARVVIEDGRLPGADPSRATGALHLDVSAALSVLDALPAAWMPVTRSRGLVTANARVARERPGSLPDVDAYMSLEGLDVRWDEPPAGAELKPWVVWATRGEVDARLRARFEGADGRTRLNVQIHDPAGKLVDAAAVATLPMRRILARRSDVLDAVKDAPWFARFAVPPRSLDALPDPVRPAGLVGSAGVVVSASGTLEAPEVHAQIHVDGLAATAAEPRRPIDLVARATYAGAQGNLEVEGLRAGQSVLSARSEVHIDVPATLFSDRPPSWTASARATLDDFPLDVASWLSDVGLAGRATGEVELTGLHEDAELYGTLRVDGLRVGTAAVEAVSTRFAVRDGRLGGDVFIDQRDGSARAHVEMPVTWGDQTAPTLVEGGAPRAELRARNLDVSALGALAGDIVSRLEGRLDAHVEIGAEDSRDLVRGWGELSEGIVQMPAIGQEFRQIEARVLVNGSRVELEHLRARGITGSVSATGTAVLDGYVPRSLHLQASIPRRSEIPVTLEGVTVGRAWGRVNVDVELPEGDRGMQVDVAVPTLHVELPETSQRNVQALDDAPHVRIGVQHPSGRFEPLPVQLVEDDDEPEEEAAPMVVNIELGREVWVRQGTRLRVRLTGAPTFVSHNDGEMTGQIEITEGFIDVIGKRFEVDEGVVTFTGDPANPTLVVRARWESPEGVAIVASFTGTAQDGNLALASEPPYTESEILSILIFGTPEGTLAGGPGGEEAGGAVGGAAGVGSGIATAGLNRALSDLSDLEITTRVDTSDPAGPRPGVAVQVTRRLAAEISYNFAAGSVITRTPDRALLTLMLRLPRRWSVETTLGDAGTSILDLVWRHRY